VEASKQLEREREYQPAPLEAAAWIKVRGTIRSCDGDVTTNLLSSNEISSSVSLTFPLPITPTTIHSQSQNIAAAIRNTLFIFSAEVLTRAENLDSKRSISVDSDESCTVACVWFDSERSLYGFFWLNSFTLSCNKLIYVTNQIFELLIVYSSAINMVLKIQDSILIFLQF